MNRFSSLGLKSLLFFLCVCSVSCAAQRKQCRIVLLPDTQSYVAKYPDILQAQVRWIAAHDREIDFVLQQGDLTSRNTDKQWQRVASAFAEHDGHVPYVLAVGNHDLGKHSPADTRYSEPFNRYFPYEKYAADPRFGGAFEPGKMDNVWYRFRTGSIRWLVLSLEFAPRDEVLAWAGEVVAAHPRYKVIINTHAYLYSDDTRMDEHHKWNPRKYGIGQGKSGGSANDGQAIWSKLVSRYANIVFVFCGHVLNDGTGCLVSTGIHGNRVCQLLANYQNGVIGSENGGNGYLRILDVDACGGRVSVRSYSPYLDTFLTEPDQQFVVEGLDID